MLRLPPDGCIGTSPTFFAAMAAASLARKKRVPFVMEIRDLWPAIFVELGVLKNKRVISLLERWEMWLYHRATRIVTVTESFRQNLIQRGVAPQKVHTVTNGADVEFWQPRSDNGLRKKLGLEDRFLVLYIGAHGISHALEKVLDAAKLLTPVPSVQFVFVGEGAEKERLTAKAEDESILNVRFLDPVNRERVREFYAAADACLVPLRNVPLFETFIPSKMFEVMAMGKPIIGSVRGEAADILERSGSAIVVEPEDTRGIAEAIIRLQAEPCRGFEMGQAGRRFVEEKYSGRSLSYQYLDVMRSAIEAFGRA